MGGIKLDLSDLLNFAQRMRDKDQEIIGRLSSAFGREFREFLEDKDHLESTYDIRKKQITLEAQQKLKDEFQTRFEMIQERHDHMWNRVYEELDIDPNGEYSYNRKTNEVTVHRESEKKENSFPFNI